MIQHCKSVYLEVGCMGEMKEHDTDLLDLIFDEVGCNRSLLVLLEHHSPVCGGRGGGGGKGKGEEGRGDEGEEKWGRGSGGEERKSEDGEGK